MIGKSSLSNLLFSICLLTSFGCASTPKVKAFYDRSDPVVSEFSQLAVASVSDAIDQIAGQRGYMSHNIRPIFPSKICGRAVTVLATPSKEKQPPTMALDLIEETPPGRILVIVMEGPDGADVAAFGGIMGTGSKARGFTGAVLDGGCRDVIELRAMNFPVFAKGIVPSNSSGRYINIAKNEPVRCGGVMVHPGDIIVGDVDGIAVVPKDLAMEILARAQELEAKEAVTAKDVIRLKSIRKATEKNQRI